MGCFLSNLSDDAEIYSKVPELRGWMKEFQALALSGKAVEKFWEIYKKIDVDGSGSIEIKEMLVHFDVDRTKFTKRVFGIFDEDDSGFIDLREFILALWNYCTLSNATLVIFAFDLYDRDGSGIIDSEELSLMLKEVYGKDWQKSTYAVRIQENIQGMQVDAVDIDTFRKFVKKHPALLFPAFEMQRKMQKYTLGVSFWKRLADKRLRLSSGQFIPIKKFMEMHLDKLAREDKQAAKPPVRTSTRDVNTRRNSVKPVVPAPVEESNLNSKAEDAALADALTAHDHEVVKERASLKPARRKSLSSTVPTDINMASKFTADGVPFEVGPTITEIDTAAAPSDNFRKRRGSTMGTPAPKNVDLSGNSKTSPPEIYDALVAAARLQGQGDGTVKKRSLKQVATGVKVGAKYASSARLS